MKNFIKIIIIVSLIVNSFDLIAQDNIILKDGTEIKGKVELIEENSLKYRKESNLEGPLYELKKVDIFMVQYQNGTSEMFKTESKKEEPEIEEQAKTQVTESISDVLKEVTLTNGKTYVGNIITDDGVSMLLNSTTIGKIYIDKTRIKLIEVYDPNKPKEVEKSEEKIAEERPSVYSTRYFFNTNGMPQKKKEGYVMVNIWGVEFQKAVSNKFTVGGMTSWLGTPLIINAKFSQKLGENLHLGLGALGGSGLYLSDEPNQFFRFNGALGFGSLTFGNKEYNITVSSGYGHIWDLFPNRFTDLNGDILLFSTSGLVKLGKSASLMFENFYYQDQENVAVIIMPGIRFYNKSHVFQLGLINPVINGNSLIQEYGFPAIPFCSWFVPLK